MSNHITSVWKRNFEAVTPKPKNHTSLRIKLSGFTKQEQKKSGKLKCRRIVRGMKRLVDIRHAPFTTIHTRASIYISHSFLFYLHSLFFQVLSLNLFSSFFFHIFTSFFSHPINNIFTVSWLYFNLPKILFTEKRK